MIDALSPDRVSVQRHGTTARPSHQSIHFFDCSKLAPEPWANGGGTTRTVALQSADDHAVDWRISIATLNGASRFSLFPGLDRTLLLLDEGAVAWLRKPVDGPQLIQRVEHAVLLARSVHAMNARVTSFAAR